MSEKLLPYTKMMIFIIAVVAAADMVIMPMLVSISNQAAVVNWVILVKIAFFTLAFLVGSAFLFTATLRKCRTMAGS